MMSSKKLLSAITTRQVVMLLFLLFTFYWFAFMNAYHVLYYQEQTQLFLFNSFYFQSYWSQPGGPVQYAGAFLTQFSYYLPLGACIYTLVIGLVGASAINILKHYQLERWYFAPMIPAIGLLFAYTDLNFRLSYALCLGIVFLFFRAYLTIPSDYRRMGAFVLLFLLYGIAAGNVWLLALLIVSDNFLSETSGKQPFFRKIETSLLEIAFCLAVSFCTGRFLYIVTFKEAFLGTSPFALFYFNYFYLTAWIALPVLLLSGAGFKKTGQKITFPVGITGLINGVLTVGMIVAGVCSVYHQQPNRTVCMSYELDREKWDKVLEDSSHSLPSELTCYFTNIALYKTGELSSKMFYYDQVGPTGLLLGKKNGYFNRYCMGNLFYHLGVIAEAKHCAFEALVGNSSLKEPNAQTLKYLVITSVLQRNTADFNKYVRFFEQSLFYRKWAEQQKQTMNLALTDANRQLSAYSNPDRVKDFFINYKHLQSTLISLLESNPNHQMAFEYLMAYYLLEKNFNAAKHCLDTYYANFDYPEIPVHWQEFLALYYHANKTAEHTLPVSQEITGRMEQFQLLVMSPSSWEMKQLIRSRYGNTYWHYVTFPLSSNLNSPSDYETKTIY